MLYNTSLSTIFFIMFKYKVKFWNLFKYITLWERTSLKYQIKSIQGITWETGTSTFVKDLKIIVQLKYSF